MMKDRVNIAIAIKQEIIYGLRMTYLHLTFARCNGQVKVMDIIIVNISKMATDRADITNDVIFKVVSVLSIGKFKFDLAKF